MREGKQIDHQPAGGPFGELFEQPVEGLSIGVAREQLGAVDQAEQRHRLLAQGVDDVVIIDDMTVLAVGIGPAAVERHQQRAAHEQLEAIIEEPDAEAVTDQPRRHRVEHLAQGEAAR